MILETELEAKIDNIKRVFDTDKIISLRPDMAYIQKYYKINKLPYSFFHTNTDLIYMGISKDGIFKEEDLLGAAKIIEGYIRDGNASSVLEIATGRGANSFYLAQKFPDVNFSGLDISETQLNLARKKAKKLKNYFPEFGDYHDLSRYQEETFDLIFEVEALCYSTQKEKVIAEVKRVLKKGGLFILFDGYLNKQKSETTSLEMLACNLVEKGMALSQFESYQSFANKVRLANFEGVYEENLSQFVLPTTYRFERLAEKFFKHRHISRILTKLLPQELVYNAAAGYLMPTLIKNKMLCYMLTAIKKL